MATAGPFYPGAVTTASVSTESANNWVNAANIGADDGSEATITAATYDAGDISFRLIASGFNFSSVIPAGSTINGITVEIEQDVAAGAARDFRVQLQDDAAALVGANKATATAWPASPTIATYGGSADTWTASPTAAMVNDADFGVVLSVEATAANTDIGVDFIRVTIDYTGPVGQTVTQASRFDNSNTFYAHVVTLVTPLTQASRFDNSNAFYGPTVTAGAVSLAQSARFDNSNAFYGHVVSPGTVTVTQSSRFDGSNAFYAATVSQGGGAQALTQSSRFDSSASFYAAVVSPGPVGLTPALFANSNSFYAPTVSAGAVTVTAGLFSNTNTFYSPTVVLEGGTQALTQADRFDNSDSFYAAVVTGGSADTVEQPATWGFMPRLRKRRIEIEPEVVQVIEAIAEEAPKIEVSQADADALMRAELQRIGIAYQEAYTEIYLELIAEARQQQEDEQIAAVMAALL